jgi:hypothetical protein
MKTVWTFKAPSDSEALGSGVEVSSGLHLPVMWFSIPSVALGLLVLPAFKLAGGSSGSRKTLHTGSFRWTEFKLLNAKLSATESPTLFATVQNLALSGFVSQAGGCAMQTSIRGSLGTLVVDFS